MWLFPFLTGQQNERYSQQTPGVLRGSAGARDTLLRILMDEALRARQTLMQRLKLVLRNLVYFGTEDTVL